MTDLSRIEKLRTLLGEAFDFLGGCDDAADLRDRILAALTESPYQHQAGEGCARCGQLRDSHIDLIDARPGQCATWIAPSQHQASGFVGSEDIPADVVERIAQRIKIIREQDTYSKQVGHAQQLGFLVEQHGDAILARFAQQSAKTSEGE